MHAMRRERRVSAPSSGTSLTWPSPSRTYDLLSSFIPGGQRSSAPSSTLAGSLDLSAIQLAHGQPRTSRASAKAGHAARRCRCWRRKRLRLAHQLSRPAVRAWLFTTHSYWSPDMAMHAGAVYSVGAQSATAAKECEQCLGSSQITERQMRRKIYRLSVALSLPASLT